MDPVTHALASLTVGRAGAGKLSRLATPMLLVAGTIADLDWASAAGGPEKFLEWRRAATHSLIGTLAIAACVAAIFSILARGKSDTAAVKFTRAFVVCVTAATAHLLLDLTNSSGVELFWPFSIKRFGADLLAPLDVWLLILFALLLGVPAIFRLATSEIGAKAKTGISRAALAALVITMLYVGARWELHARAVMLMQDQLFHGETPAMIRAYPEGANPFIWDGVVTTTGTLQEARVPVMLGRPFPSERAVVFHKPVESLALRNAQSTDSAIRFLRFAQFPRAKVIPTEDGFRVEISDLRYDRDLSGEGGIFVSIELDKQARVTKEEFQWGEPLER
jgi:membrane-bound metal-dependent hydrolase YbcI (DUF457 family)